jgi:hypothetical protein
MKTEMRRVLAQEPYEKKIQKVEQLLRLVREFPRQPKTSPATLANSIRTSSSGRNLRER